MSTPNTTTKILALIRRYAAAIASGVIEARAVATMSDEELAAFDKELSAELDAAQKEAEDLADN